MLLDNLLAFGRLLRRLGLDVHPGRMLDVTEALQHVDIRVQAEVYHTCRALLVHRHDDLSIFDRAFDAFWRQAHCPLSRDPVTGGRTGTRGGDSAAEGEGRLPGG